MPVDYNIQPRGQLNDENRNVIQGGTRAEIQILTCTVSTMLGMSFSEIPKSVLFQTRTAATDVEFVFGTATVANGANGGYLTVKAGQTLTLDCASTGPYYFRNSAANQGSIIIGLALL